MSRGQRHSQKMTGCNGISLGQNLSHSGHRKIKACFSFKNTFSIYPLLTGVEKPGQGDDWRQKATSAGHQACHCHTTEQSPLSLVFWGCGKGREGETDPQPTPPAPAEGRKAKECSQHREHCTVYTVTQPYTVAGGKWHPGGHRA